MRVTAAILVILLTAQIAFAQGESILNVRNAGSSSCQSMQSTYSTVGLELEKTAYLQWITGYATAIARLNKVVDVFPIYDSKQLVQMVIYVCKENPTTEVELAAANTIVRLQPFWVRGSDNLLTLTWNGKVVKYFEASVKPLQLALRNNKLEIAADGLFGIHTGEMIMQFAETAALAPEPLPSAALLYMLTKP